MVKNQMQKKTKLENVNLAYEKVEIKKNSS